MSFQAYFDNAEKQTGITPREFLTMAQAESLTKSGEIVAWLKADHALGHGHANAIARLVTRGEEFVAAHHTGGTGVLYLDGIGPRARPMDVTDGLAHR